MGGVINFITRRNFDGFEATGGYDFGDEYSAWNAGLTAGTTWDGGSAYISYSTYQRDGLLRSDRDYAAQGSWNADGSVLSPVGTECLSPVGEITACSILRRRFNVWSTNTRLGVSVTPVGRPCDTEAEGFLPELERHSVLAGLSQELTDRITLDVQCELRRFIGRLLGLSLGGTISTPAPTGVGIPLSSAPDDIGCRLLLRGASFLC